MYDDRKREAVEIIKLPYSLLEDLPIRKWRSLSALLAVVLVSLVAFFVLWVYPFIKYAPMKSELNKYQSIWESQGITSYSYTIEAFEVHPMTIQKTTLQVYVNGGQTKVSVEGSLAFLDKYGTIPELFYSVGKMINTKKPDNTELTISYDPDLGFPTYIGRSDSRGAIAYPGLFSYIIKNFSTLP